MVKTKTHVYLTLTDVTFGEFSFCGHKLIGRFIPLTTTWKGIVIIKSVPIGKEVLQSDYQ